MATILKSAAISIGKQAVMSRLAVLLPGLFLGAVGGIVNPIVGYVVEKILVMAVVEGEMGAFFWFIDIRVNDQGDDFIEAAKRFALAKQSGDKDAVKKAEDNLKKKFKPFVHLSS